jgi:ABC-type branched-subunit amino acid transport system substrate-binding protein
MRAVRASSIGNGGRLALALSAGACLALAGCSSSGGSTASTGGNGGGTSSTASGIPGGVIKVGLITPLSGPLAGLGQGIKDSVSAFINEENAAGGVNGHQLQLVVENDKNDPAVGVAAAEKLQSQGVVVSFGAGLGPVVASTLPVLMKEKILTIFNESTDVYATNVAKFPYFFAPEGINLANMQNMAGYAKKQGLTKVATITDGLPYSLDNQADFVTAAKADGLTVVSQQTYSPTAVDLSTQVAALKGAGAQAIAATTETQLTALYTAVKQLNWNPLILGNQITPISGAADVTSNTVYPCMDPLAKGGSPSAGVAGAIGTLKKAGVLGVEPESMAIYRDEVQLFAMAVKKADSTDPGKLKTALESFANVAPTGPEYKYTFTAGTHAGWAGLSGQCHLTPVSSDGLNYQVP